jgi:hypothetical protein
MKTKIKVIMFYFSKINSWLPGGKIIYIAD